MRPKLGWQGESVTGMEAVPPHMPPVHPLCAPCVPSACPLCAPCMPPVCPPHASYVPSAWPLRALCMPPVCPLQAHRGACEPQHTVSMLRWGRAYLKHHEHCAMVGWMLWQVVTSLVLEPEGIDVRLHRCAFNMQRCPLTKHAQGCTSMHMQ